MTMLALDKAFREANESVDDSLTDALGLFRALEAVMEGHPSIMANDPRNATIWAVMRSLEERLAQVQKAVSEVWVAARGAGEAEAPV